jgi:hypothetical protein
MFIQFAQVLNSLDLIAAPTGAWIIRVDRSEGGNHLLGKSLVVVTNGLLAKVAAIVLTVPIVDVSEPARSSGGIRL